MIPTSKAVRHLIALLVLLGPALGWAQTTGKRPFTVRDDIALTQFGDIWSGSGGQVSLSPKGDLIAVQTTHGSLADRKLHDEVRFYALATLRLYVEGSGSPSSDEPAPLWIVSVAATPSESAGAAIQRMQWLEDDRHLALLEWTEGRRQLCLADVVAKQVIPLTDRQQDVMSFSIRDASHYVYTVLSASLLREFQTQQENPSQVGSGHNIFPLLYPERFLSQATRADLWAVQGGEAAPVIDPETKRPIFLYGDGIVNLALSKAGDAVVTVRPLSEVSSEWESRYGPPYPASAFRLRAGRQDLTAPNGWTYAGEYIYIPLRTGTPISLTDGPVAMRAGWWEGGAAVPVWSDDGATVFLPGTFAKNNIEGETRPCFAVVRIHDRSAECVRPMRRNLADGFEEGYLRIDAARFEDPHGDRLALTSRDHATGRDRDVVYAKSARGGWRLAETTNNSGSAPVLEVSVRARFSDPPVLVATDKRTGTCKVIYDPNPQLGALSWIVPERYTWADGLGHEWHGLLYRPTQPKPSEGYPLVIQNHGFREDRFAPSGGFPSAFIAQELAASGIAVLHVRDCEGRSTPLEGPCNVQEYETAIASLSQQGVIDRDRVGLIGFSRTVYYVMKALTTSRVHFRAASITDGITLGYVDYLDAVGADPVYTRDDEAIIGGPPIGNGLADWLRNSPEFNIDRISTPLRVVATRGGGILSMWEPYALLERLHRPVDFIILNTNQHVVTDPAVRFAAQEGALDWFRFWLQGYVDPDSSKTDQYQRWRSLKQRAVP